MALPPSKMEFVLLVRVDKDGKVHPLRYGRGFVYASTGSDRPARYIVAQEAKVRIYRRIGLPKTTRFYRDTDDIPAGVPTEYLVDTNERIRRPKSSGT